MKIRMSVPALLPTTRHDPIGLTVSSQHLSVSLCQCTGIINALNWCIRNLRVPLHKFLNEKKGRDHPALQISFETLRKKAFGQGFI